jgi:hypothetical protein
MVPTTNKINRQTQACQSDIFNKDDGIKDDFRNAKDNQEHPVYFDQYGRRLRPPRAFGGRSRRVNHGNRNTELKSKQATREPSGREQGAKDVHQQTDPPSQEINEVDTIQLHEFYIAKSK